MVYSLFKYYIAIKIKFPKTIQRYEKASGSTTSRNQQGGDWPPSKLPRPKPHPESRWGCQWPQEEAKASRAPPSGDGDYTKHIRKYLIIQTLAHPFNQPATHTGEHTLWLGVVLVRLQDFSVCLGKGVLFLIFFYKSGNGGQRPENKDVKINMGVIVPVLEIFRGLSWTIFPMGRF